MKTSLTKSEARTMAYQFLLNESKPSWCSPVDILLTANIILLSSDEGECWASQSTLSAMLGIHRTHIRRPLDRLIEHGWITETSRKKDQQSNLLYPQFHNIPLGVIRKSDWGNDAQTLASYYHQKVKALPKVLSKNGRLRAAAYPHRGWAQHWAMVMQNWLNDGWTAQQIQAIIDKAFQHLGHIAKRGPQCIKTQFESLASAAGITK